MSEELLPTVTRRFVDVEQAAAHLGLCQKTIRTLVARGDLPAYRIGRKILRLDLADVEALLVPTTPARPRVDA